MIPLTEQQITALRHLQGMSAGDDALRSLLGGARPGRTVESLIRHGLAVRKNLEIEITEKGSKALYDHDMSVKMGFERSWRQATSSDAEQVEEPVSEPTPTEPPPTEPPSASAPLVGSQPPCIEPDCGTTSGLRRYDGRCAPCADRHEHQSRRRAGRS